ncbi:uncharacterized protein RJT21DRAFT_130502 [Scheffersomyces amazonensis]|uniref:uncharacterized protein n=1 Tax=Scheffersomyces amazonensis TaxID=1078765 RepID=UPI00315CD011
MSIEESTQEIRLSDEEIENEIERENDNRNNTVRSVSGPNWIYGTTNTLPRTSSVSSVSGLCLTERGHITVPQPEVIQNMLYPSSDSLKEKILTYRNKVSQILNQNILNPSTCQEPLLVITGPSFIKDVAQAKACATWLGSLTNKNEYELKSQKLSYPLHELVQHTNPISSNDLLLTIRTNLSKYNYNYDDPELLKSNSSVMTFEIQHGIPICRALLCELAEICPIVGETCDTITPQYLNDLYCLGLVSSTLIESQLHRELASGVSYPVGFTANDSELPFDKSMYPHKITAALDALYATSQPHQFLSVSKIGTVAVVGTTGNDDTFIILQINLELNFEELKQLIQKVYSYSKLAKQSPRVLLDVGKIHNTDYEIKLSILKQLLTDPDTKYTIVGVLIDSGDNYIPTDYPIDNEETDNDHEQELDEQNRKLLQLNRYFIKKRIRDGIHKTFSKPKPKSPTTTTTTTTITETSLTGDMALRYEHLINANNLISELHLLSTNRRQH